MYRLIATVAVCAGLTLQSGLASAHHSRAGIDLQKTVSVTGTVQKFFWASPHIYVRIDVANDEGGTDMWQLEGQSPAVLRALD